MKHARAGDGPIHVAFRCQVHHQIGVGLLQRSFNGCGIGQIHLLQPVPTSAAASPNSLSTSSIEVRSLA